MIFVIIGVIFGEWLSTPQAQEGKAFGSFIHAHGISLDPQKNVYVADVASNEIQKFDSSGSFIAEIGGYGWGQLEFDQPYDVCASNGLDVFVADYGNHRIQRYNRKLEYIGTLYTRESSEEQQRFGYPGGITVNRFGGLLVCDRENHRVLKISTFSRVAQIIGGIDAGKGRLVDPLQVEVDEKDRIYVLEGQRIVVFDHFGNFVRIIGSDTLHSASGFGVYRSSIYVTDSGAVVEFNTEGRVINTIHCSELLPDTSDKECVDVAADAHRVVVLFRHTAVVVSK